MAERKRRTPARTPEMREKRLISMAVDLAEQKLADGTASTQLIGQLLRLGTQQSMYELEKLQHENELLKARTSKIVSDSRSSEMYEKAVEAIRAYRGEEVEYFDD